MHEELQNINQILSGNDFPLSLIQTQIGQKLDEIFIERSNTKVSSAEKATLYIPMFYEGYKSLYIKKSLSTLLKKFYPQVSGRFLFKTKRTIGHLFRYKDAIPTDLQSLVVYSYVCSSCMEEYIGSTVRQLSIRRREHAGRSYRTNLPYRDPPPSAIRDHSRSNEHPIVEQAFSIVQRCSDRTELLTVESLVAYQRKPKICKRERPAILHCFT